MISRQVLNLEKDIKEFREELIEGVLSADSADFREECRQQAKATDNILAMISEYKDRYGNNEEEK